MAQNQNQAITPKNNVMVIKELLEKSKEQIAEALPKHLTPERIIRVAVTALRTNKELYDVEPYSFVSAIIQASQLGLEPDGFLGYAYLVPFKAKSGRKFVNLIIGYRGLIELARRSGNITNIYAQIVYENEKFKVEYGLKPTLKHTPLPPSKRGDEIVGVYAVAQTKDGESIFQFLWKDEIDEIRKTSKAGNSEFSPWTTFPEEMIKKTGIRRLAKYLPLTPEFTKAAVLDEYATVGIPTKEIFSDEQAEAEIEQKTTDRIAEKTAQKMESLRSKLPTLSAQKNEKEDEGDAEARALAREAFLGNQGEESFQEGQAQAGFFGE